MDKIFVIAEKLFECAILISVFDVYGLFVIYCVSMIEITGWLYKTYTEEFKTNPHVQKVVRTAKFVSYMRVASFFKRLAAKQ